MAFGQAMEQVLSDLPLEHFSPIHRIRAAPKDINPGPSGGVIHPRTSVRLLHFHGSTLT
jgi:hypothetical protein